MGNILCIKCGKPSDHELCDECYSVVLEGPNPQVRQKHETRNPTNIMQMTSNYTAMMEKNKKQVETLEQTIASMSRILSDKNTELLDRLRRIQELEHLVNESLKDYHRVSIFWVITLIILGITIYKLS